MKEFAVTVEQRLEVFKKLTPYFGKIVSSKFVQNTHRFIEGIDRIHNLIEGIYKPKNSRYALAISSMLENPYADRLEYQPDRSWYFFYSPKAGKLDAAINDSLFACKEDNEPVLVLQQVSDKKSKNGATHRILGLGIIDGFDRIRRLFRIREFTIEDLQHRLDPSQVLQDDLIETALQLEALEDWSPFVEESRAIYKVAKQKRDRAFRDIVLNNYGNTCAVTRSRFVYRTTVEAQAAHIISRAKKGTDDPRNGLSLSQTAHWAFDQGLFTISDRFEIQFHPEITKTHFSNFPIFDLNGNLIQLPDDEIFYPHAEALKWHKKHIYGRFLRS